MCLLRAITTHVLTLPTSPVSSITTYITVMGTTIYSGSLSGPHELVTFADVAESISEVGDQLESERNVILSVGGSALESLIGLSCSTNMMGLRHDYVTVTRFLVSGLLSIIKNG